MTSALATHIAQSIERALQQTVRIYRLQCNVDGKDKARQALLRHVHHAEEDLNREEHYLEPHSVAIIVTYCAARLALLAIDEGLLDDTVET